VLHDVDTRRAARRPGALKALVEAIAAAPAHEPETEALEWKSSMPLEDGPSTRYAAARQILGFANREPDRAMETFEGCGYLLIGLEPGKVHGTSPLDPADIDNWLSEYLGQDGPQWRADYVELNDASVLIFTVEPPRWGDPIHTLRKGSEKASPGRIFIRRAGKTVEADPAEVRMLEARSQRKSERIAVDLIGEPEGGSLRSFLAGKDDYRVWREDERLRLNTALSHYRSASSDSGLFGRANLEREIRTPEDYEAEVSDYLREAKLRW
jgi:hypothetical protein